MHFLQAGQVPVHAIFSCHLCTLWEMIHFLIFREGLVKLTLDVRACPTYRPFLVSVRDFSEPVVFESVSDQWDNDAVVEFEVVALILRLVRADTDGVNVWSENEVFLIRDVIDALWSCCCRFVCHVKLARLMLNLHQSNLVLNIDSCLLFIVLFPIVLLVLKLFDLFLNWACSLFYFVHTHTKASIVFATDIAAS